MNIVWLRGWVALVMSPMDVESKNMKYILMNFKRTTEICQQHQRHLQNPNLNCPLLTPWQHQWLPPHLAKHLFGCNNMLSRFYAMLYFVCRCHLPPLQHGILAIPPQCLLLPPHFCISAEFVFLYAISFFTSHSLHSHLISLLNSALILTLHTIYKHDSTLFPTMIHYVATCCALLVFSSMLLAFSLCMLLMQRRKTN